MGQMMQFSTYMLNSLATFLRSEPIIYVFGLCCSLFIVRIVITMMSPLFSGRR